MAIKINKNIVIEDTNVALKDIANGILIETGSNSNGSWIKFNNGTIIEYGRGSFEAPANTYNATVLTLPVPTISTDFAGITMQSTSTSSQIGSISLVVASYTNSTLTIRAYNNTSGGRAPDGFWYIIGKWK